MDLDAGLRTFFALRFYLHSFAMRFSRDGCVDIRIRRAPLHGIIRQQDAHNIRLSVSAAVTAGALSVSMSIHSGAVGIGVAN